MKHPILPAVALALAVLLPGCGLFAARTARPDTRPATQETAPTPEPLPRGELHFVTDQQDGLLYLTDDPNHVAVLDFATGSKQLLCRRQDCPHTGPDCDAWLGHKMREGVSYSITQSKVFLEGNKLYRVFVTSPDHGGGPRVSTLTVGNPDGSGQTLLCEDFAPDKSGLDIAWLADDDFLYAVYESNPPREDGLSSERTVVLRIGKADGSVQQLLDWSAGGEMPTSTARLTSAAVCDGQLVMSLTHPPESHTGSMAEDAAATGVTYHVLDLNTGTLGQALPLEQKPRTQQQENDPVLVALREDTAWQTDDTGTLTIRDLLTGQVLQQYPDLWPDDLELESIFAVTDRCIAIDGACYTDAPDGGTVYEPHRLVFDRADGSLLRELPATWLKDGASPRLPDLYAENGTRAILRVDSRLGTATDMGQDGSVYTHPTEEPVYGVIDLDAYLDGSQDWTLCTPEDLGPVSPTAP